jgi:cephalosporin hydroxylase
MTIELEAAYHYLCKCPSDIVDHLPRFVELVVETDAQHVIELGTRYGVSTVAWLYGLKATGGRLTSVDVGPKPDLDFPDWEFHQADDLDTGLLDHLEPADIVFIDTSHVYEHTLDELHAYVDLVRPGGYIVCHDTELEHPDEAPPEPRFPVKKAIEEFTTAMGLQWTNDPRCWGRAEIRVP